MCTLNLQISDSTDSAVKMFSRRNNISVEQFIISAINEKMSVMERNGYLDERAERGKSFDISTFLDKVPDVTAEKIDRK